MKTRLKMGFLALVGAIMAFQPLLVTANVSQAVTYLQNQSQDAWITMALAADGQTNIPTSHLASVSGTTATDYAKAILALAAVNTNPATFGNIDYIAKLKTYHTNGQMGDDGLANDDVWSVLALSSVGQGDSIEAIDAKNFILANQNSDGGWGWAVGNDSDTNDTAAAIMALIEAGVSADGSVITNALDYLATAQNSDGGFGYQPGGDSDSGSDSWVISALYKAGQDPASWKKGNKNPITHLESLQDDDGGFWWVPQGTSEWNNKAMTPYAVVALSQKSYPVGYYTAPSQTPGTYHLVIEGSDQTICDDYVAGDTAMDLIINGAEVCDYTYNITQESFGPYLRGINSDQAEGLIGWLYTVNFISPPVGAADYTLQSGDEALFFFGQWGIQPTKISVDNDHPNSGSSIQITAEYFDGNLWLPLSDATIKGGNQNYVTNSSGKVTIILSDGYYELYSEKEDFIRSQKIGVTVGDVSTTTNVGLTVEVVQGTNEDDDTSIVFTIDQSQINFGSLQPGETASQNITLSNGGNIDLAISASISGDELFTANTKIDNQVPGQYAKDLDAKQSAQATTSLTIPSDFLGSGIKNGQLIFWASPQ